MCLVCDNHYGWSPVEWEWLTIQGNSSMQMDSYLFGIIWLTVGFFGDKVIVYLVSLCSNYKI